MTAILIALATGSNPERRAATLSTRRSLLSRESAWRRAFPLDRFDRGPLHPGGAPPRRSGVDLRAGAEVQSRRPEGGPGDDAKGGHRRADVAQHLGGPGVGGFHSETLDDEREDLPEGKRRLPWRDSAPHTLRAALEVHVRPLGLTVRGPGDSHGRRSSHRGAGEG